MIIGKSGSAYRCAMQRHRFLLYPAGAPGTGLLLLRTSVVLFLLSISFERWSSTSAPALCLDSLAVLIVIGLWTRTVACLSVCLIAAFVLSGSFPASAMLPIAHGIDALIIVIVGPGAFSMDARLFGRRTLTLSA